VVNAPIADIQMLSRWLQIEEKDYTIHLYHDGMQESNWLKSVANQVDFILVHRPNSSGKSLEPLFDHVSKIIWFGDQEQYNKLIDYFLKDVKRG